MFDIVSSWKRWTVRLSAIDASHEKSTRRKDLFSIIASASRPNRSEIRETAHVRKYWSSRLGSISYIITPYANTIHVQTAHSETMRATPARAIVRFAPIVWPSVLRASASARRYSSLPGRLIMDMCIFAPSILSFTTFTEVVLLIALRVDGRIQIDVNIANLRLNAGIIRERSSFARFPAIFGSTRETARISTTCTKNPTNDSLAGA
mmetsp:Transcript_16818/g.43070  ORF Transcript_16818/g.43070 Transcript_16818/m.43070 type:complete len:207 (-) Transcript_16818:33-653(-)